MKNYTLIEKAIRPFLNNLSNFKAISALIARVWIGYIFVTSGLSKLTSWDTTVVLFKYDYHVPLLPAELAAYIGTCAEFVLPALLILGLGGRLSIFAFFMYNIICVVSFSFLWTPAGNAGLNDHITWGILLMLLMFYGPGKFSFDYLLHQKFGYFFRVFKENKSLIS